MSKQLAVFGTALGILLAATELYGQQNLIPNGGFEKGLSNWAAFWSRKPGAGSARVVADVFYSGGHSALIEHHDAQDWSFAVDGSYAVKAGEIYELSAWIRLERAGWAELSVITYDKNRQVIEWSFAPRELVTSPQEFRFFRTRFIIPEQVRHITPRLIGGGECRLFADDVSLMLVGTVGQNKQVVLQNPRLRTSIQLPTLALEIEDKASGIVFRSAPATGLLPISADSSGSDLIVRCSLLADDLNLTLLFRLDEDALRMQLEPAEEKEFSSRLVYPGTFGVRREDYLLVPRGTGFLQPVTQQYPFGKFGMYDWKSTMAFVGVTDLQSGYMLVSDDPWDTVVEFPRSGSLTTPQLLHEPTKRRLTPRTFYFVPIQQEGYAEMCRWYRRHVEKFGYVKTWRQKIAENPRVDLLRGAVDFWFLDSAMQTTAMIDSLLLYGIDRAIISLSGSWYAPEDKSELIEYINESGYLSSRYDIYTDVWPPTHPEAPWYRTEGYPEDVIVNEDGSLRTGWLAYLDGNVPFQGYYTCSSTHERYAERWIGEELETQPYNCRFIDVELASSLVECWSSVHPTTRKEDAEFRNQLLDRVKNGFGLVTGSEEAREWAFSVVDFGEGTMTMRPQNNAGYDWANPVTNPEADYERYNISPQVRVPLHGLIYHDVHVPTWYTGDGQSKVPQFWDEKDLWNILYASMPLFAPPNRAFWLNNKERYLTSYFLVCSVFRACGFVSMTAHRFLNADRTVQMTEFDNGWRVTVNFGSSPHDRQGTLLAPKGFLAENGREQVSKLLRDSQPVALARLSDRLFINPYGRLAEFCGVSTAGSVLLKKEAGYLHLAFIGSQNEVIINPAEMPWQMESLRVFTYDRKTEITPEPVGGGRLKIVKKKRVPFYRLEGAFTGVERRSIDQEVELRLTVFPNPFNQSGRIILKAPAGEKVSLRLYNLLGKQISVFYSGMLQSGEMEMPLRTDELACGVYFLQLSSASYSVVQKMVLVK